MDMARSMSAEYKSTYNFWAKAISTACHSANRLYLHKGLDKTPYEILTANKPNISYFNVFGCKCFYLIKGVRLSKFDSWALEGIFVGYGAESRTYKIYDKASGRVIESSSGAQRKWWLLSGASWYVCRWWNTSGGHRKNARDFSAPLRDTLWWIDKNYALLKWSPHRHNVNKPQLPEQMIQLSKDKL